MLGQKLSLRALEATKVSRLLHGTWFVHMKCYMTTMLVRQVKGGQDGCFGPERGLAETAILGCAAARPLWPPSQGALCTPRPAAQRALPLPEQPSLLS